MSAGIYIEAFQAHRMRAWHDEKVSWRDRVQVHGHDGSLVFMNHAGLGIPFHHRAEDARVCPCSR